MDDPKYEESNYWTQKLNQCFLPYSITGQYSFFVSLETAENMLFCGSIEREQWI